MVETLTLQEAAAKERRRARNRAYYLAHKAEGLARSNAWNAAHREYRRAYARAHYQAHRDEIRVYGKNYYATHRDQVLARSKAWAGAHKQQKSAGEAVRCALRRAEREQVIRAWAPEGCVVCGFTDLRAIDAHHRKPLEKERNIGSIKRAEELSPELAKCVPLCRNHHQILHDMWRKGCRGKSTEEVIAIMRAEVAL